MPDLGSWDTSITQIDNGLIAYRGQRVEGLIEDGDLASTLWLVLFGTTPTPGQSDAVRRALIAALDHGPAAPSTLAARATASTRSSIPFAIAAGMIAFAGPAHGGAAEEAAAIFAGLRQAEDQSEAISVLIHDLLASKRRMPGYGHPYHSRDPRVIPLMSGIETDRTYRDLAVAVEKELALQSGKSLPMNADAAVAALLLDAGLSPADVTLVTALGRAFGLAAHSREERTVEKPFRAPSLSTINYRDPAGDAH
jgi:citrate synthase